MMAGERKGKVLVTGASGFVAGHVVATLLRRGFSVRGTVRSIAKYGGPAGIIDEAFLPEHEAADLEFAEASLTDASSWDAAVHGCQHVIHVASPVAAQNPKHEDDMVRPAVDGTMHVLRACTRAGTVRRVVVTSSTSAIYYGHNDTLGMDHVHSEADWSDFDKAEGTKAYIKSKTLAERAAWQFVREGWKTEGLPRPSFELVTLNPCFILGPMPTSRVGTSMKLVHRLMKGSMPGCPDLYFNVVDVRDVAAAHVRGLDSDVTAVSARDDDTPPFDHKGRYILQSESLHLTQIAALLAKRYAKQGYAVPTSRLPNFVVWLAGLKDPALAMLYPHLGTCRHITSAKAVQQLGIKFRSAEEMLVAGAEDLISRGLVHPRRSLGQKLRTALTIAVPVVAAAAAWYFGYVTVPRFS